MKKKALLGFLLFVTLFFASSCSDLFTSNIFSGLKKDPSKMTDKQLIAYASALGASGKSSDMAEAFLLLKDRLPADPADDPELYLLTCNMALGGSGMNDVISNVIQAVADDGFTLSTAFYQTQIDSLDMAMLGEMTTLFGELHDAAPDSISSGDYEKAIIIKSIQYIETNNDLDVSNDPDIVAWSAAAGLTLADFLDNLGLN